MEMKQESSEPMKPASEPLIPEGVPRVAVTNYLNAPVHIDVGGTIYTSTLEILTSDPDSRLGKMFNGTIPIVLDTLKQHYFIDRDGEMFQHILNYLRNKRLTIPKDFKYLDLLLKEAQFYQVNEMVMDLFMLKYERLEEQREYKIWLSDMAERVRARLLHRRSLCNGSTTLIQ